MSGGGNQRRNRNSRFLRPNRIRAFKRFVLRRGKNYVKVRLVALRHSNTLGARGERAAARYLVRNFFFIWEQNARTRRGEIDIVASQRRTLVFVEVKTRRSDVAERFSGRAAIDRKKQDRLHRLAERYLYDHRALAKQRRIRSVRFDLIEVVTVSRFKQAHIEHFTAAF